MACTRDYTHDIMTCAQLEWLPFFADVMREPASSVARKCTVTYARLLRASRTPVVPPGDVAWSNRPAPPNVHNTSQRRWA